MINSLIYPDCIIINNLVNFREENEDTGLNFGHIKKLELSKFTK